MPAGFTPPPGPARVGAERERSDGSTAAALGRGVLVPAVVATLIGLAFVVVFLDAFHAATPHELPVGVVGTGAQAEEVAAGLDDAGPGRFAVTALADEAAAREAVLHRDVFGALLPGEPARLTAVTDSVYTPTRLLTRAMVVEK